MKRFSLISAALVALALVSFGSRNAQSADYEVTLSTIVPTASVGEFTLSGAPQIANAAYIRSLTLSNYGSATTQQIDLYRTATSSTAATVEMTYVLLASTTVHLDFPARAYRLSNLYIKKSDTGSTAKAQIVYE
jgi:hypothetical protein